jgi:hypothetical protein
LSCLQRIIIRYQKHVGYSKVAFAAKIVAPAVKLFSLPNWAACSEPVFAAELRNLQRTIFIISFG